MDAAGMNPGSSHPVSATGVVQAALNIVVVVLLILLVVSSYRSFRISHSVSSFGVLAVNTLFLGMFVTRPPAKSETSSLPVWFLATAGVVLPLLMRPGGTVQYPLPGYALQVAGLAMVGASILSLRRSFAVVPGNRGIRSGGFYRVVRHPMYLSELTTLLGVVLANLTAANLLIWVCACGVQYARARAEEELLSADPEYRAYRERVRYRLVPGLL